MDQAAKNLYVLWVGNFLTACSFSLVMPFLPRFIAELGVAENLYTWSGVIFAVTFLSSSIMAPIWGNLADRYGRKPMLVRAGISISIVYFLMSLVTNHVQLFWLRLLNGAFSGYIPSAVALVATNTPEDRVGRYLAILQTGMATGTILGPLLGGTLAELMGIRWTMRVAAVLVFVAILLAAFLVKEKIIGASKARTSVVSDIKLAVTNRGLLALMISALLIQAALQSLQPILSNFIPTLVREGWITAFTHLVFGEGDAADFLVGFVFALPALATVLTAPRWARLGDRMGFAKLLSLGLMAAGILLLPQSLVQTVGWLMLLRFVFGIATAAVQPSVNAALAEVVHPSFRGRAYGINTSANNLGSVVGPSLGGWVADAFGPRAVFVVTGLMMMFASVWVQRMLVNRRPDEPLVGGPEEGMAGNGSDRGADAPAGG
ncbi:MFS family permease [Symbiobacterium terraclitae]|uniref:MFS family permease n=1 Tax=Symbiobacterium terraclitae TaxID=557451 RepID=A0ABS4JQT1_9FIRM|nr:MFS transporter [Symbiobacterium terraclitae]MBP2017893.1 MFS family permease [Symbiobacterium terraclitae]